MPNCKTTEGLECPTHSVFPFKTAARGKFVVGEHPPAAFRILLFVPGGSALISILRVVPLDEFVKVRPCIRRSLRVNSLLVRDLTCWTKFNCLLLVVVQKSVRL